MDDILGRKNNRESKGDILNCKTPFYSMVCIDAGYLMQMNKQGFWKVEDKYGLILIENEDGWYGKPKNELKDHKITDIFQIL